VNLFLISASPEEILDINQVVTLNGVVVPLEKLMESENPSETIEKIQELLGENQQILIETPEAGFRPLIEEGKKIRAKSQQFSVLVPPTMSGLMSLKAMHTLKIPAGCSGIYQSEQVLLAAKNEAQSILLDAEQISRFASLEEMLQTSLAFLEENQKERVMLCCKSNLEQIRTAAKSGVTNVAAAADLYRQMVENPLTDNTRARAREEWILNFTRSGLFE
jgi:hypothetical protein